MDALQNLNGLYLDGSIKIRLLLRPVPQAVPLSALHDPFLTIPSPDPISKWFLGELVTEGKPETRLCFVVISLLTDQWHGQDDTGITNRIMDELWLKESMLMAQMQDSSPGYLAINPFVDKLGIPRLQPPLFFCKFNKVLFNPVCPSCNSVLTTCQDDSVLESLGLKAYSKGVRRYLWCSSCGGSNPSSALFFVPELEPAEQANTCLVDLSGLLRLWGQAALRDKGDLNLPCMTCEQKQACYALDETGGLGAKGMITALSFYDYYLKVIKYLPLDVVTTAELMSGIPRQSLLQEVKKARNPVVEAVFEQTSKCLHPEGHGLMKAADLFEFKLCLWKKAVEQTIHVLGRDPSPLMSISPQSFGVECLESPTYQSKAPSVQVRLRIYSRGYHPVGCPAVTRPAGIPPTQIQFMPPEFSGQGQDKTGELLLEACVPAPHEDGKFIIQGTMTVLDGLHEEDWKACQIHVRLGRMHGLGRSIDLLFRPIQIQGGDIKLSSHPVVLSQEEVSIFQVLTTQPGFHISFIRLPLNPACADLYAIGVLGARILFATDTREFSRILTKLLQMAKIAQLSDMHPEEALIDAIEKMLNEDELLNPDKLFWSEERENMAQQCLQLRPFWIRSLGLICKTMAFSKRGLNEVEHGIPQILTGLEQELDTLLSDLSEMATVQAPVANTIQRDPELARIISVLLEDTNWLKEQQDTEQETISQQQATPLEQHDEELDETVVLGPATKIPFDDTVAEEQKQDTTSHDEPGDIDETIVLPPKRR